MPRILRQYISICENCAVEVVRVNRSGKPNRFCSRSCSNSWQHKHGMRRAYCADKHMFEWWAEKFEPTLVEEKRQSFIDKTRQRMRKPMHERMSAESYERCKAYSRKSWIEKYGIHRALEMKNHASEACGWKNRTLEQRLGLSRAAEVRKRVGALNIGKRRSFETRKKNESCYA